MDDASTTYWATLREAERRRESLKKEILVETARSPLRPADLGRLHAEWETIRRRLVVSEMQRVQATRAVLSEIQLVRLQALEELVTRRSAFEEAGNNGLVATDCRWDPQRVRPITCEGPYVPMVSAIDDWGPREDDGYLSKINKYLGLTAEKLDRISNNRQEIYSQSGIGRMRTVVREIVEETQRDPLDPIALGLRYAEVESLRRRHAEDNTKLHLANLNVLTPEQRLKRNALVEAIRLHEEVEQAQASDLIQNRCKEQFWVFLGEPGSWGFDLFGGFFGDCPDRRALNELPQ